MSIKIIHEKASIESNLSHLKPYPAINYKRIQRSKSIPMLNLSSNMTTIKNKLQLLPIDVCSLYFKDHFQQPKVDGDNRRMIKDMTPNVFQKILSYVFRGIFALTLVDDGG